MMINPESQILFKPLISPFGLSVGMRMICSGRVLFNVELFAELLHKLQRESGVPIRDDFRWYAESWEDVIEVELGHSFSVDGLITGEKDSHFGASLVCDSEY